MGHFALTPYLPDAPPPRSQFLSPLLKLSTFILPLLLPLSLLSLSFLRQPSSASHYPILPHLSSPVSYIYVPPSAFYLSNLVPSVLPHLCFLTFLSFTHPYYPSLFSLSSHIPQILPRLFSSLSPIITPPLPYVPVAVPQAVGCGGRWLAG